MAYSNRTNTPQDRRQNSDCCDGWEHYMSGGGRMCGYSHGDCQPSNRMNTYSQGGYPANPPRRQGYISDHLGNGRDDDVPALLTAGALTIIF